MLVIKDLMSFVCYEFWMKLTGRNIVVVLRFGFYFPVICFAKFWSNVFLPIEPGKPPENALDGSNGFIKSLMPKWPPIGKHPPPNPFFFLDFDDNLRFRVWIPSFFIVNGRFTYK